MCIGEKSFTQTRRKTIRIIGCCWKEWSHSQSSAGSACKVCFTRNGVSWGLVRAKWVAALNCGESLRQCWLLPVNNSRLVAFTYVSTTFCFLPVALLWSHYKWHRPTRAHQHVYTTVSFHWANITTHLQKFCSDSFIIQCNVLQCPNSRFILVWYLRNNQGCTSRVARQLWKGGLRTEKHAHEHCKKC